MGLKFDPNAPLSPNVEVIEDAVIVPWPKQRRKGAARPAGVFHPNGKRCKNAVCWRYTQHAVTLPMEMPKDLGEIETLPGTTLFGGMAYGHFGHALCESTGRLWALDLPEYKVDRIYFFPKQRRDNPNHMLSGLRPLLRALDVQVPAMASNAPVRCERLIVPPQGFGVNDMVVGAPEMRRFMRSRLKAGTETPSRKIYVSRSALYSKRGRILHEKVIEDRLAAEGYEIFHPQSHDIETQLDTYRTAAVLISTDNSALHLAAFVLSPKAKVGIVLRRPGDIYKDFEAQLERFAGLRPNIFDFAETFWGRSNARVNLNEVFSEVNFKHLGQALQSEGFTQHADWPSVDREEMDAEIAEMGQRNETVLRRVALDPERGAVAV